MNRMKRLLAMALSLILLIEPCGFYGGINKVKAQENTTDQNEYMWITGVSFAETTVDHNALEITGNSTDLKVQISANAPEGWYLSEVDIYWDMDDEENDKYESWDVYESFGPEQKSEDGNYVIDLGLHKYLTPGKYQLSSIEISFQDEKNKENYYFIYGEVYRGKIEWTACDSEWNDYDIGNETYDGFLDYTIKSASGKDTVVPLVTDLQMVTKLIRDKNKQTEMKVTVKENGSGISYIAVRAESADDEEGLVFFADGVEQCKGTQTITLRSDKEYLKYRTSGKYDVVCVEIEDYAGNYMYYMLNESGTKLIGYEYKNNKDGTVSEIKHTINPVKYTVCLSHVWIKSVTKATVEKSGSICEKCKYCGTVRNNSQKTISRIKKVSLSNTSYLYNGKSKKPTVSVYNASGNKIDSKNYTVTYPEGRKNVGNYKVKIVFKNNYKGTVYKTFTIKPKGTSITSTTSGTKKFTVKWKKQSTQTSGYQVCYSTYSNFKSYKTKSVSDKSATGTTIKNLKSGKKYYVKVRTYKTAKVNGENKRIYSSWSDVKKVTTK